MALLLLAVSLSAQSLNLNSLSFADFDQGNRRAHHEVYVAMEGRASVPSFM